MPVNKQKGTGALVDDRLKEEKLQDFTFEEMVTQANPVKWVEKKEAQWRKFLIFDQNGSGSCVAQTLAKLLGILYFLKEGTYVHFSATHIYQRRKNKPDGGMSGVNAMDIARDGVTLEVLAPSQKMTDKQMDDYKVEGFKAEVGSVFKIPNYVEIKKTKDIETIASIIETTKKGVMVWFFFNRNEWKNIPVVLDEKLTVQAGLRHSVTAVDYTLYKGEKALIIEDSWGPDAGFKGQRIITESFFKKRNWFGAYPIAFKFGEGVSNGSTSKPQYTFSKTLEFNSANSFDEDVKALQDILKYEGLFPQNIESTGKYGSITADAVLKFQKKYSVDTDAELNLLKGRIVGKKTISMLNKLYS